MHFRGQKKRRDDTLRNKVIGTRVDPERNQWLTMAPQSPRCLYVHRLHARLAQSDRASDF